jgi:UDP-glucose 4-epimerase
MISGTQNETETCAVFGGTGFLGRHVCMTLRDSGKAVRSFSRRGATGSTLKDVDYLKGRLSDVEAVRCAVRGASTVWHLVSATLPSSSLADSVAALHEEVAATLRLCEIAQEEGVERLVFVSSGGSVYGITSASPIPEDHPTNPICAYGVQKLAIEKYLLLFERQNRFESYVLRLGNPYGEDQDWKRPFGAIANFVNRAARGLKIAIWGDGSVVRDYFHVEDLTDVFRRIQDYNGSERVFNVGSGKGASLKQLLAIIEGHLQISLDVSYDGARIEDAPYNVLDITRAEKELGWTPKISLESGIGRMLDAVRKNDEVLLP